MPLYKSHHKNKIKNPLEAIKKALSWCKLISPLSGEITVFTLIFDIFDGAATYFINFKTKPIRILMWKRITCNYKSVSILSKVIPGIVVVLRTIKTMYGFSDRLTL